MDTVKAAIIAWEKMRIPFNILLLALGLMWSWDLRDEFGGLVIYWFWAGVYGVALNACYSLGVLAEIYVGCFTSRSLAKARVMMFIAGTLVSIMLTTVTALSVKLTFQLDASEAVFHH